MTKTQKLTKTILSSVALLVLCDVAGVANQSLLISGAQAASSAVGGSKEGPKVKPTVQKNAGATQTAPEGTNVTGAPKFKTPGLQEKWQYIYDRINDGTLRTIEWCQPQLSYEQDESDPKYQAALKAFMYLGDIVINAIKNNSDKYKTFKQDFSKLPKQENLKTVQDWQANLDEQTRLLGVLNEFIDNVAMDINVWFLGGSIPGCKPDSASVLGILANASAAQGAGFTQADTESLQNDSSWRPLFDDFAPADAKSPGSKPVYEDKYLLPLQQGIALAKSKIAELNGGNVPGGEQGAGSDQQNKAPFGCDPKAARPTDIVNGELDRAIERFKGMNEDQRNSLPPEEKDLYGAKLDYDLKKQQYDGFFTSLPDGRQLGVLPPNVGSSTELANNLRYAETQLKDSCKDLNNYLANKGRGADRRVLNIDVQPVFLMSAAEFTQRYGGGSPQLLPEENTPTPAFQYSDTIPCGKLSPQVMAKIVKGADKMKPGNSNDIKAFKAALDATFNESNNMKPIGSKFYDNLVEWIEDKSMTDEKHQLLNYTINQLDILTSSEPKDVFDFSKVYSEYNKTIGNDAIVKAKNGDFQKGWMDFYNDTLKNSKERNIDALYRLMMNMYYTRINKGEPQDSPSMQAMKRIIDKLQGLHLKQKCSKK